MLHGLQCDDGFLGRLDPEGFELLQIQHLVSNADDQDVDPGDLQDRCRAKATLQPAHYWAAANNPTVAGPFDLTCDAKRPAAKFWRSRTANVQRHL